MHAWMVHVGTPMVYLWCTAWCTESDLSVLSKPMMEGGLYRLSSPPVRAPIRGVRGVPGCAVPLSVSELS